MRLALLCLILAPTVAHAETTVGVHLGLMVSNLVGQVDQSWAPKAAIGVPVSISLDGPFGVGIEPTLQQAGSADYSLGYFTVPLVIQIRYPVGRARVRGSLGLAPGVLISAKFDFEEIDDKVRGWDVSALAGIGIDRRSRRGRTYFAELRFTRGLATLRPDPGLFVVNEAVGLWIGFAQ